MKIFKLREMTEREGGEYVLGSQDTGTHATYMIYGYLRPDEGGRLIKPGKGHEEIIYAIKGDFDITGDIAGTLREGSAFHIAGETSCYLKNNGRETAYYVASGGHSGSGH
jgi:hypothetical protein